MKRLSRVGVLGDVHGEFAALMQALELFEQEGVRDVLCVGDVVDGPEVERCLEVLRARQIPVVRGNHERWCLAGEMRHLPEATMQLSDAARAYVATWPATLRFGTAHGDLLLCHGVGEDDMSELRPETRGYGLQSIGTLRTLMLDEALVFTLGGHTHQRMVRAFQGLVALNAGTLVQAHDPVTLVLDFDALTYAYHRATNGAPQDVVEAGAIPKPATPPAFA